MNAVERLPGSTAILPPLPGVTWSRCIVCDQEPGGAVYLWNGFMFCSRYCITTGRLAKADTLFDLSQRLEGMR